MTTTKQDCRNRRRLAALALALLLALVPLGLLASDRFSDVPTSNPYHDDIDAVADAGIMEGCNPPANSKFCPADKISRAQLAGALARADGLGGHPAVANADKLDGKHAGDLLRLARGSEFGGAGLADSPQTVVSVDITTPGPGYVLVSATMDIAYNAGGTCPCIVRFYVSEGSSTTNTGFWQYQLIEPPPAGLGREQPVATQWVFPVGGAGVRTYTLQAQRTYGTGNVFTGGATITALYVPFGANGAGP